jgi:predicted nucleotidyltransferase
MGRDEVLRILKSCRGEMAERFGVRRLRLFGSYARNEAGPRSDVDLLVEMPPSYEKFFALQEFLEEKLNRTVDLGRKLRPSIFLRASSEMIDV